MICNCGFCTEVVQNSPPESSFIAASSESLLVQPDGPVLLPADMIIQEIIPGELACLYHGPTASRERTYLGTTILSRNSRDIPMIYVDPSLSRNEIQSGSRIPNVAKLVELMAHFELMQQRSLLSFIITKSVHVARLLC